MIRKAFASLVALLAFVSVQAEAESVRSPDGRNLIAVDADAAHGLTWRVERDGAVVVAPSSLRLATPSAVLGSNGALGKAHVRRGCDVARGLIGKRSRARDCYVEASFALVGASPRAELTLRAYDDGVAYRWRFPETGQISFTEEPTELRLTPDSRLWAMPVQDFTSSYEEYYAVGAPAALPANTLAALPMLVRTAQSAWAGVTEADLDDFPGLYFRRRADGVLEGRLSPSTTKGQPAAVTQGARSAPWRVVLLGDRPGALLESSLVQLLNPPSRIADTRWIKPGKTTFPWWNDYVFDHPAFKPGLNTETMLAYIDFCAEAGIPYHTLDGYAGEAWYGGPIIPDGSPQDVTKARPEIDLPRIIAYAKEKGVGIRVWTHWEPFAKDVDRALDAYAAMGVKGVMVDFMNRDDQAMVRFYHEVAEKAAKRRLTVIFHGAYKPTGLERTWPNVLTYEGVRNLEYDKFDGNPGSTPTHEVTTPFVRMLAGPMDYHQGGFRHVAPENFHNRFTAPEVMGTRARMLATYVVFDNPGSMAADSPSAYRGADGIDVLTAIPNAWDETRVLAGEPGEFIVTARRKGGVWWIGAMTNERARKVSVALDMLGAGRFVAERFADNPTYLDRLTRSRESVTRGSLVTFDLAPAGGAVARVSPATN